MPPKPAGETRHTRRENVVRERVTRIVKRIQIPDPNPRNLTKEGIFARRCASIAEQHFQGEVEWHKRAYGVTSIVRFIQGRQGAWGKHMDIMESACVSFEEQWRTERAAARAAQAEPAPEETPPTPPEPAPEHNGNSEIDAEIMAMASIVSALDPLSTEVQMRVLHYVGERFGVVVN